MLSLFIALIGLTVCFPAHGVQFTNVERTEYAHPKTGATWQSVFPNKRFQSLHEVDDLLGAREESAEERARRPTVRHGRRTHTLDSTFDARTEWPQCPSIAQIRDQSKCGSCWAFGAVEAMSDRICIHSQGRIKKILSATDLLACCKECGYGCNGGWPAKAWDYWKEDGIVTGGSYNSSVGCRSYPFAECSHYSADGRYPPCPSKRYETPACQTHCDTNKIDYQKDKTFAESSYNVLNEESEIRKELKERGPMEVSFDVYEDFPTYHSGVYFHAWGKYKGGHAVRLLGWGEENGVPYWLLANSWNEEWGDGGYFRVLRGEDECNIESGIVAGMPKL